MSDTLQHNLATEFESGNIAIVRALPGLGDFLCCVPTLRALRQAFPSSQLTLIGLPQVQPLVQRFRHYLTGWVEFPGFPGIPEVPFSEQRLQISLTEMRQFDWDGVLQIHGSGSCINRFVQLLGTRWSAGFYPPEQPCPDANWFLPYPEHLPEVWRSLKLLEFLQIPLQGDWLEFPLQQDDWLAWQPLATAHPCLRERYVCIHPGASVDEKVWQPRHFAAVADALAIQGWNIVLTGTADEINLIQAVAQQMRFSAINLAGQTSLGSLAVLLKQSSLLVCNDTGVSHLADALQVKSVVIFAHTDPQRWAPLNRQRHRVVGGLVTDSSQYPTPTRVLEEAMDLLHQEFIGSEIHA